MTYHFDFEKSIQIEQIIKELEDIAIKLEKKEEWIIARKIELVKNELLSRCIGGYINAEV